MAALLVGMTIMAIFMSMALPAWRTAAQREKEAELIFRGQQYARAIVLFQRKYANTFPPNVQILLDGHFLRKKYKDPITDGDFQPVYANQQAAAQPNAGGIVPTQGQRTAPTTTVGGGSSFRIGNNESTPVLPVMCTSPGRHSRARFAAEIAVGANSRSAWRSIRTR